MEDKWEAPIHPFATPCLRVSLFPSHVTAWGPKPPASEQKVRPLLSYLLSEQKPTEGQDLSPPAQRNLAELPPQQPQTLLGSWPVDVLRAGLHCPCTSSRITTTAAIPQLCCHQHHCPGPLHYHPPEYTALTGPNSVSITTQQVVKSTGSGDPPTSSCLIFDHIFQLLCA